ncbi:MAG: CoA transferase [Pigmentiphaga sp.]|nr:CoA transferase [Pigmentiphaga sp.]
MESPSGSAASSQALAGIRIVDFSAAVVGPYASKILADRGAEVIKIEAPDGDVIRWIAGPSPTPGMGGKFMHLNRGKYSVCADLKKPGAQDFLQRLLKWADVIMINMRPQAVERLGLDPASVWQHNPQLVHCAMVGFGEGPYRNYPAYDSIIQGASGLASLFALQGSEPNYVPYVVADRTVGLMAANAILMGLMNRYRTGRGQQVEVPMYESMAALVMGEHLYGATYEPALSEPGDLRLIDPQARPLPTRDGYVCLTTNTDQQAFRLMDLIGRPDMRTDPRFANKLARAAHSREYFSIRAEAMREKTTAQWLVLLREADIPAMAYQDIRGVLEDPHFAGSGVVQMRAHPSEGMMRELADPIRINGEMGMAELPAPRLGEHLDRVMGMLGCGAEERDQWLSAGVLIPPRDNG